MGDHKFEVWFELFHIVESHHTLQFLAMVLSPMNISKIKLLVEVKYDDLLYIVPLAGNVESVRVVINLI